MSVAEVIHVDDLQNGYLQVVDAVMSRGEERSPRGMATRELRSVTIELANPLRAVPVGVGRDPNLFIGAAETAQFIAGLSHAKMLTSITKNFAQFVEFDRLYGAYGPRTYPQYPRMLQLMCDDPETRQAGVTIFRPDDTTLGSKDLPCTLDIWYGLRDGALDCTVIMRSNDVVWGLTYDAWVFTAAQAAVAYALGVPVGRYTHHAVSLHIYVDRDQKIIDQLHPYDGTSHPPYPFTWTRALDRSPHLVQSRWKYIRNVMEAAVGVRETVDSHLRCVDAMWYRAQLLNITHSDTHKICCTCRYVLPGEYFYDSTRAMCRWCDKDVRTRVPIGTYSRMMLVQDGKCAMCGGTEKLWLDHDHKTGIARGILCDNCNKALGLLHDDPERALRGARYLDPDIDGNEWTMDFPFLYRARPRDIGGPVRCD